MSSDLAGTGQPLSKHARRAAQAYGATADHYAGDVLSFWDRFGAATVSRLRLADGCGAPAVSAGHARERVRDPHSVAPGHGISGDPGCSTRTWAERSPATPGTWASGLPLGAVATAR